MSKTAADGATMLSIADAMTLVEQGMAEVRVLFFRRKQREKRRR